MRCNKWLKLARLSFYNRTIKMCPRNRQNRTRTISRQFKQPLILFSAKAKFQRSLRKVALTLLWKDIRDMQQLAIIFFITTLRGIIRKLISRAASWRLAIRVVSRGARIRLWLSVKVSAEAWGFTRHRICQATVLPSVLQTTIKLILI